MTVRGRWTVALLALSLGACAPEESSDPFEGLEEGWNRVATSEPAACSHGSEYSFLFRPADPERVAVFFQGGGACWMGEICALDRQPTYRPTLDDLDEALPREGIFDFANPDNPIAGWSVLFVPYCSGDVHVGSTTRAYEVEANDSLPARSFEIRHAGLNNTRTALEWLYTRVTSPSEVLVTGVSAGSLGSAVHAHAIARHYPEARVVQLGDAAGGYRAGSSTIARLMHTWGAEKTLADFPSIDPDDFTFEDFYRVGASPADNLRMAQINYDADEVQLGFLALLGVRDRPLLELLDANLADIQRDSPTFRSYVAPGTEHGVLREAAFYDVEVDGVSLRDWTADLVAGADIGSVACAACR
jgi:hypothetical protein